MAKLLKPTGKWNGKTIALDDGHGMHTPGKRTPFIPSLGRQIHENEFNRAVVKFLADLLLKAGFRVLLVAPTDSDTSLQARTDAANAHKCDIYVSVHYNALAHTFDYSTASGISVHIYPGQMNKASGRLAKLVGKYLQKGTAQKYRGVKEDNFHVVRATHMPAILTENGFMDDEREALLMIKPEFQREVANEHFLGIMEYFGLDGSKYIAEKAEQPKPAPAPAPKPEAVKPKPTEEGITMDEFKKMLGELRGAPVAEWAKKDWDEAKLNGYFDGSGPQGLITRQEAAIVVNRLRNNFKEYIDKRIDEKIAELDK